MKLTMQMWLTKKDKGSLPFLTASLAAASFSECASQSWVVSFTNLLRSLRPSSV